MQEVIVGAKMGAAAAGVADDGVVVGGVDEVELAAGEEAGGVGVSVVRVEGAAAGLDGRGVDFAVVGEEHVHGGAVDVGEGEVLHAAGEHEDAAFGRGGFLDGRDELVGKARQDARGLGFEAAVDMGNRALMSNEREWTRSPRVRGHSRSGRRGL